MAFLVNLEETGHFSSSSWDQSFGVRAIMIPVHQDSAWLTTALVIRNWKRSKSRWCKKCNILLLNIPQNSATTEISSSCRNLTFNGWENTGKVIAVQVTASQHITHARTCRGLMTTAQFFIMIFVSLFHYERIFDLIWFLLRRLPEDNDLFYCRGNKLQFLLINVRQKHTISQRHMFVCVQ